MILIKVIYSIDNLIELKFILTIYFNYGNVAKDNSVCNIFWKIDRINLDLLKIKVKDINKFMLNK